jgi:hypothetical protein
MSDKVPLSAYLPNYGLPTTPIAAIYAPELGCGVPPVLSTREALGSYRLFGKSAEGFQSLGSIALRRCHRVQRELERMHGPRIPLDQILSEIEARYRSGYVFQPLKSPHPSVGDLCGPRLASVRVLTVLTESGPKVIRACWKIPAGDNMADNYWRPGNLLAQIDFDSGAILFHAAGEGIGAEVFHSRRLDRGFQLGASPAAGRSLTFGQPDAMAQPCRW